MPHKAVRNEPKFRQIQIREMRKPDPKASRVLGPLHPHMAPRCCHPFPARVQLRFCAQGRRARPCHGDHGQSAGPKAPRAPYGCVLHNTILCLWGAAILFGDKSLQFLDKNQESRSVFIFMEIAIIWISTGGLVTHSHLCNTDLRGAILILSTSC